MDSKNKIIIDYNNLPKKYLHGKEVFDYDKFIGLVLKFQYENIIDNFKIEKVYRKNRSYYITINYNNNLYDITIRSFKCGKFYKTLSLCSYKHDIGDLIGDWKILNRKYEKVIYPSQEVYTKQYLCECQCCGYKNWKTESILEKSNLKCSVCGKNPKVIKEGINDIPTTAPWMISYFQGGYEEAKQYSCCSSKKINPICPYCKSIKENKIKISWIYNRKGIFCACNDGMSYPNKLMYNILKIKNIPFIQEYSPNWITPKRYDFYLMNENVIIEMDGGWHYKDNKLSGKSKESIRELDIFKDKKAEENNIKVYRINCLKSNSKYIYDNIAKSELNNILKISENELNQADIKSHNSLVKEVCDYKNMHNNMTSSTIAKHFNLSNDTIQVYVKIGEKFGWCKKFKPYYQYKFILVSENGIDIGIFKGAKNVREYLKHKHNINTTVQYIRELVSKNKKFKEFSFKRLDDKQSDYFLQNDTNFDSLIFQNDIIQKSLEICS